MRPHAGRHPSVVPCFHPLRAWLVEGVGGKFFRFKPHPRGKLLMLPCGRCLGCRIERSRQWAVRIVHEAQLHDDTAYLTLTYDPEHLPKGGTLVVKDAQDFMKRLRTAIAPVRIRFFLCGEYGEKLSRPHYHACLFGYGFPDRQRIEESKSGHPQWRSDTLDKAWGRGRATIGAVVFETAQYVAGYCTKKVDGPRAPGHYLGKKKEFCIMSRRPGIGHEWLRRFHGDVYPSDEVVIYGKAGKPPRYYDKVGLVLASKATADLLARREAAIEEQLNKSDLVRIEGTQEHWVCPRPWNPRRLRSREEAAMRRAAMKKRNVEA